MEMLSGYFNYICLLNYLIVNTRKGHISQIRHFRYHVLLYTTLVVVLGIGCLLFEEMMEGRGERQLFCKQ